MMRVFVLLVLVCVWMPASAWGPDGHRLIARAAAPLLCPNAADAVRDAAQALGEDALLDDAESLERIGLWADQIRGTDEWSHTAPWHYVNVPDDGDPRRPPRTADGNVIVSIERFAAVLPDISAGTQSRREALQFLVHFVADVHQPLHVGRSDDRGGNRVDVSYADQRGNLHYFWDTAVIRLSGRSLEAYVHDIAADVSAVAVRDADLSVRDWAQQVFALRERVYAFDTTSGQLSEAYVASAIDLAEQQIVLGAAHLANTLNAALCR